MAKQTARTTVGALDAHDLLGVSVAKPQFGGSEQPIDNVIVSAHAIVDELRPARRSDDEQRWRLAL